MAWDSMSNMRDLLRSSLGRSLRTLSPFDRLLAAWPVACGPALAAHGELTSFDDGILTVLAPDPVWRRQLASLHAQLLPDLRRIAAVDLREIHFEGGQRVPSPPRNAGAHSSSSPARTRPPGKPQPAAAPRRRIPSPRKPPIPPPRSTG